MSEILIKELLTTIVRDQSLTNYEISLSPIPNCGLNITSYLYKATISSPKNEDLKLFIKIAALSEEFRKNVLLKFFYTENKFYTDLAIEYDKIQEQCNLNIEARLFIPKFYGCNMTFLKETFVFEDLTAKGFSNHNRFDVISWEYAQKAVEELAKLHALSFAYGKKYPEKYLLMLKDFKYELPIKKEHYEALWAEKVNTTLELTTDENKNKLRKFIEQHGDFNVLDGRKKPFRVPVICHGDYKTGNLMHRVSDNGSIQIVILDYQLLRTSAIPLDLIHFTFTSTDSTFRRQYFDQLLEHYYKSLGKALHLLGVDINDVYTREDYDNEMKMFLPYGLRVGIMHLSAVLAEDVPPVDLQASMDDILTRTGEAYRERFNGIVDDLVEWGVL